MSVHFYENNKQKQQAKKTTVKEQKLNKKAGVIAKYGQLELVRRSADNPLTLRGARYLVSIGRHDEQHPKRLYTKCPICIAATKRAGR